MNDWCICVKQKRSGEGDRVMEVEPRDAPLRGVVGDGSCTACCLWSADLHAEASSRG